MWFRRPIWSSAISRKRQSNGSLADEKVFIRAFLISLAAIASPEEFVDGAIPLLKRDSYESLHNKFYKTAVEVANGVQKKALESAIKTLKIKVKIDLPRAKGR
jgi:hypothetical protein